MNYILLIFIAVVAAFYYNTLTWLVTSWINNVYYTHGFLVPVISGYLIWSMRDELASVEKKQAQEGLALIAGGIILQGMGSLWTIRSLSGLSLLVTAVGIVLFLFGWDFLNKIKFPMLFLLLMIPLPFVDLAAPPIQTVSAVSSAGLANLLGIPVTRDGLQLALPGIGTFEVAVECSGLKSIISLLTIATIFAFILEGEMLMRLIIVVSSIPLALAGNILRVTSVLAVANNFGQQTAMNYFHDFSSLLLFSVALGGLFLVGRCFGRLRFKKIF